MLASQLVRKRFQIPAAGDRILRRCASTKTFKLSNYANDWEFGSQQFWLGRRVEKYKKLANSIQLPHPEYFMVDGQRFNLPYVYRDSPLVENPQSLDEAELERMAAVFGERGVICMSTQRSQSGGVRRFITRLELYRVLDDANDLLPFVRHFGGRIRVQMAGRGHRRATVYWQLAKLDAIGKAAHLLGSYPSCQQKQLNYVSQFVKAPPRDRVAMHQEFQTLRGAEKPITSAVLLAQIVDKRGILDVSYRGSMRLKVLSTDVERCQSIMTFLQSLGLHPGGIYLQRQGALAYWNVCKRDDIAKVMRLILPYLSSSKPMYEAVLREIDAGSHHTKIRQALLQHVSSASSYVQIKGVKLHAITNKIGNLIRRHRKRQTTPDAGELKELLASRETLRLQESAQTQRILIRDYLEKGGVVLRKCDLLAGAPGSRKRWQSAEQGLPQ